MQYYIGCERTHARMVEAFRRIALENTCNVHLQSFVYTHRFRRSTIFDVHVSETFVRLEFAVVH
jgi:hypothetical protein